MSSWEATESRKGHQVASLALFGLCSENTLERTPSPGQKGSIGRKGGSKRLEQVAMHSKTPRQYWCTRDFSGLAPPRRTVGLPTCPTAYLMDWAIIGHFKSILKAVHYHSKHKLKSTTVVA